MRRRIRLPLRRRRSSAPRVIAAGRRPRSLALAYHAPPPRVSTSLAVVPSHATSIPPMSLSLYPFSLSQHIHHAQGNQGHPRLPPEGAEEGRPVGEDQEGRQHHQVQDPLQPGKFHRTGIFAMRGASERCVHGEDDRVRKDQRRGGGGGTGGGLFVRRDGQLDQRQRGTAASTKLAVLRTYCCEGLTVERCAAGDTSV